MAYLKTSNSISLVSVFQWSIFYSMDLGVKQTFLASEMNREKP